MPNILPTGKCFDDALELIVERLREGAAPDGLWLVHAIVRAQTGVRYAHAWVEEADKVWESGLLAGRRIYYAIDTAAYMAARRVEETTRYTPDQAFAENARTGHFGPWVSTYATLCAGPGEGGRVLGALRVTVSDAVKRRLRNQRKAARREARR